MSALGDRLRQAAEQADSDTKLTAFAVIVTENSSFRFFVSHIEDEDRARALCARGLVNTWGAEQIEAAGLWAE